LRDEIKESARIADELWLVGAEPEKPSMLRLASFVLTNNNAIVIHCKKLAIVSDISLGSVVEKKVKLSHESLRSHIAEQDLISKFGSNLTRCINQKMLKTYENSPIVKKLGFEMVLPLIACQKEWTNQMVDNETSQMKCKFITNRI
jgi:hypothetical protein